MAIGGAGRAVDAQAVPAAAVDPVGAGPVGPPPTTEEVLAVLAARVLAVSRADGVSIGVREGPVVRHRVGVGRLAGIDYTSAPDGFNAEVLRGGGRVVVDAQAAGWDVAERFGFRSALAVPLPRGGEVVGVVVAVHGEPGRFGPDDLARQELVAGLYGTNVATAAALEQQGRLLDALAASEARYRTVVDALDEGVVLQSLDGGIEATNARAAEILGLSFDQLLGRSSVDPRWRATTEAGEPWPGETHPAMVTLTTGAPVTGAVMGIELPDGGRRWVSISTRPLEVGEGGLPRAVVVSFADVTARKEAERARAVAEERFRLAFAAAPVGMVLVRARDGRTLAVNDALCRLLGRDEAEIAAIGWEGLTHVEDWTREVEEIRRLLAGETTSFAHEKRFLRPDGSVVWGLLSVSVTRGADGRPDQLIGQVVDLTARRAAEERLAHQALHDDLTGLPNRALFLDRAGHALALAQGRGHPLALLFVDLDRFKLVNDSLGHDVGDQLLLAAARRLAGAVRPTDTLARLAGDEFAVLCEDVASVEDAVGVAARLQRALEAPLPLGPSIVVVSASVGVALADRSTPDAEGLLRDADAAMYLAKHRGRNRVEVFDETLRLRAVRRLEIETGLRRALEQGELRLAFQPEVDLATGRLAGIEALVRWEHPDHGLLAPSEFLPVAEETDLVNAIGAHVLREAAGQLARWRAAHPHMVEVGMAVNVSARQLADDHLMQEVEAAVAIAGGGAPLCLEITETALLESAAPGDDLLRRLKSRGVLLGIDDFGTSYSSLTYVTRLAPDFLKVDRTFVAGLGVRPNDTAIVAAVINLAHTLGLFVVAEGAETEDQVRALRGLGCDLVQGYLVSRPLDAETFEARFIAPGDVALLQPMSPPR